MCRGRLAAGGQWLAPALPWCSVAWRVWRQRSARAVAVTMVTVGAPAAVPLFSTLLGFVLIQEGNMGKEHPVSLDFGRHHHALICSAGSISSHCGHRRLRQDRQRRVRVHWTISVYQDHQRLSISSKKTTALVLRVLAKDSTQIILPETQTLQLPKISINPLR